MKPILYRIAPAHLAGHLFRVQIHIHKPLPQGQRLSLPTWIPGSYLVRDFSRHVQQLSANSHGRPLRIQKIDNHSWQIEPCARSIDIEYWVYAWDLSVRAAHVDETHAFFNGSSVFLQVDGQEQLPCLVDIQPPSGTTARQWQVYTSLPEASKHPQGAQRHGFGMYQAPNYDALIDHPVEMGRPAVVSFTAHGALHEMVFTGLMPNVDLERIARDAQRICEYQIALFEPKTKKAPFLDSSDRYVFMTMVTGSDYGGLEHRASTALMASRSDLPVLGDDSLSDGYLQFLGLVSHEYFHTWNVKRIKPQVFAPYRLQQATPTSLLWIFEGFTSYYDDAVLYRCGLINQERYLQLLSKTITSVQNTPGRLKQSVAESSFDAWTKYYKQDENSPNSIISYYTKGALVALSLDLIIRQASGNTRSLDDVMRLLWKVYGRRFYTRKPDLGLQEEDILGLFLRATGVDISQALSDFVYGTVELPLKKLCKRHGFALTTQATPTPSLHVKTRNSQGQCQLAVVYDNGAAQQGGLSAGDTLVAIDNIRVDAQNLPTLLQRYRVGDRVRVHVFRRDELRQFSVRLKSEYSTYRIEPLSDKPW